MTDPRQLHYLLQLLADDSELVSHALIQTMLEIGADYEAVLDQLSEPPSDEQKQQIRRLLESHLRKKFLEEWQEWFYESEDIKKTESGMDAIAFYLNGLFRPVRLGPLLDALAEECRKTCGQPDEIQLAQFLFQAKGLQGAREEYYRPSHSNLTWVLQEGRGLPISLSLIYMMVGARLGLTVEGCNFPNHFLTRIHRQGNVYFIDCFHGGAVYSQQEMIQWLREKTPELQDVLDKKPTAEMMLARVLNNLIMAYQKAGDGDRSQFFTQVAQELNDHLF